jgi:hypothetical protein
VRDRLKTLGADGDTNEALGDDAELDWPAPRNEKGARCRSHERLDGDEYDRRVR